MWIIYFFVGEKKSVMSILFWMSWFRWASLKIERLFEFNIMMGGKSSTYYWQQALQVPLAVPADFAVEVALFLLPLHSVEFLVELYEPLGIRRTNDSTTLHGAGMLLAWLAAYGKPAKFETFMTIILKWELIGL
jgi:hypothetical protein